MDLTDLTASVLGFFNANSTFKRNLSSSEEVTQVNRSGKPDRSRTPASCFLLAPRVVILRDGLDPSAAEEYV